VGKKTLRGPGAFHYHVIETVEHDLKKVMELPLLLLKSSTDKNNYQARTDVRRWQLP